MWTASRQEPAKQQQKKAGFGCIQYAHAANVRLQCSNLIGHILFLFPDLLLSDDIIQICSNVMCMKSISYTNCSRNIPASCGCYGI